MDWIYRCWIFSPPPCLSLSLSLLPVWLSSSLSLPNSIVYRLFFYWLIITFLNERKDQLTTTNCDSFRGRFPFHCIHTKKRNTLTHSWHTLHTRVGAECLFSRQKFRPSCLVELRLDSHRIQLLFIVPLFSHTLMVRVYKHFLWFVFWRRPASESLIIFFLIIPPAVSALDFFLSHTTHAYIYQSIDDLALIFLSLSLYLSISLYISRPLTSTITPTQPPLVFCGNVM